MARPARLELATPCLEAVRPTLPNLARGVANRTDSASWGKFPQPAFSFIRCYLSYFCRRFLQFALHFRDRQLTPRPIRVCREHPSALNCLPHSYSFFGDIGSCQIFPTFGHGFDSHRPLHKAC